MVYGMVFYKATKDADYKIYHTKGDKYITKIQDNECASYYKEWGSLGKAQKYIRKKMKENEMGDRENG